MPRGENEEFQQRVGKLSKPLIKHNLENMLEKRTEISPDQVDLEALVDETLNFEENLESVEEKIGQTLKEEPSDSEEVLEAELEKYEYQWSKYMERHEINESELV